jgi:hypothetical protein
MRRSIRYYFANSDFNTGSLPRVSEHVQAGGTEFLAVVPVSHRRCLVDASTSPSALHIVEGFFFASYIVTAPG